MPSPIGERAIKDAILNNRALVKVVSRNDAGTTRSHQYGFLLPKPPWRLFTPYPPVKGVKSEHHVDVTWQDGRVTNSIVKWYGEKTRSEYRLTCFGRDFPFRTPDDVGSILVLVPTGARSFNAFLLDDADGDLEDIPAALGLDLTNGWAVFNRTEEPPLLRLDGEQETLEKIFRDYAMKLEKFPSGSALSRLAWESVRECAPGYGDLDADEQLIRFVNAEYDLFQVIERKLFGPEINALFKDVDDFLKKAKSLLQRRKSRAGRALENHVGEILRQRGVPFDARPEIPGEPDIVIPSAAAYNNPEFDEEALFVMPIKTTCKDRWRQVLEEGPRVKKRYLFTIQRGITKAQLNLMYETGIILIVPKELQKDYPTDTKIQILTLEEFISLVKHTLGLT